MLDTPLGRPTRMRRRRGTARMLLISGMILTAALLTWWWLHLPSTERVEPFDGRKQVIVYQGSVISQPYLQEDGEILLPLDFLQEQIDRTIYWDESTQSVIVTTRDHVLRMESGNVKAFLNQEEVPLRVTFREMDGVRYVPLGPLEKLYPVQYRLHPETGVLVVERDGYAVQQGQVVTEGEPALIRTGPSAAHPISGETANGAQLDLIGEEAGWYRVQRSDGLIGYLPKEQVRLAQVRQTVVPAGGEKPGETAWKPLGEKLVMVWEHVVKRTPSPSSLPPMPGVHVVSPTWFELVDDQANLANKADLAYVKWAHQRGYRVWGLVSNGFNPDWTHALLADFHKREKFVRQVLHYAHMYELDGINLDFENVYLEDKQRFVQLVRELTPYLHELGLTVSVDVTVKSNSERWSLFYDRAALAEVVDYVALMTYDEHWATSPVAGSVASLPWTERGLAEVLKEVPRHKLLLGVPFYTRLWKEEQQPDGSVKVSSKALSMAKAQEWLRQHDAKPVLDAKTGQWYAEVAVPGERAVYKIWLEDKTSLSKRVELVRKYGLAGMAAWRRGFETADIWPMLEQELNKPR